MEIRNNFEKDINKLEKALTTDKKEQKQEKTEKQEVGERYGNNENPDEKFSDENKEKGVGLGLKLTKTYVELQNGKIWLESELDKGTNFFVSLDLSAG